MSHATAASLEQITAHIEDSQQPTNGKQLRIARYTYVFEVIMSMLISIHKPDDTREHTRVAESVDNL